MSYATDVTELSNKIEGAEPKFKMYNSYYKATYRLPAVSSAVPPEFRNLGTQVGWPRMYLDSLEERLDVQGFRISGTSENIPQMSQWWQNNGLDEESSLVHLEAMKYGYAYVTISNPGDSSGVPIIRAESPRYMYADVDPRTRVVRRAVRIYREEPDINQPGYPEIEYATLYLPNETVYMIRDRRQNGQWVLDESVEGPNPVKHNLGKVPVVPFYNRPALSDRDGQSEIVQELRSLTDGASRLMMNLQLAAETLAAPKMVLLGVAKEEIAASGQQAEVDEAYMGRILAFENDLAKLAEFSAAELRNFAEGMQVLEKHVASYTGLPPQYLSFQSDNPASAEAIRSAEARLVKKCERKARMFGGSWEEVMRVAHVVINGADSLPEEYHRLETIWVDPSTPTFASRADAVQKLYEGGAGILNKKGARQEMGWNPDRIEELEQYDKQEGVPSLDELLIKSQQTSEFPSRPGAANRQRSSPPREG